MTNHLLSIPPGARLLEEVAVTLDEKVALQNAQLRYCELARLVNANASSRKKRELARVGSWDDLEHMQEQAATARAEIGSASRSCAVEISSIVARALSILTEARIKLEAQMRSTAIDFDWPLYVSPAGVELIAFEARVRYAPTSRT